jgi:hypothetical protein
MNVAVMIVCGICMAASFYLVYLGYQVGEGIPWLFAAFGALFGIPFISGLFKILGRRSAFFSRVEEKLSGGQEPRATFVPHWFMMTAIITAIILILAAIIIPIIVQR